MSKKEEFKNWLRTKVETLAPLSSYPNALSLLIPNELARLGESKYEDLFDSNDIEYLEKLYERLSRGGDLHQFNVDTQSRLPSAAIKKYIVFLKYNKVLNEINQYDNNPELFKLNESRIFFTIQDRHNQYPVKAICKNIYKDLNLPIDYRTNGAKSKLQQIFGNTIDFIDISENQEKDSIQKRMKIKNIMLYGAPGVGKTHNYKKLISMIEEGKSEQDIFKSISDNENVSNEYDEIFQNIKDDKRIEFVTFHQSYSYEDFIEGFRPSEDINAIVRKDGIFKAIADKAQRNLDESKKDINTIKEEKTFFELFTLFKDFIQDEIDRNQKFIINDTAYISNIEDDAFRYTGDNWGNSQRMKFSDIELLNELNIAERKDIKKTDGVSGLANQHATYFSYFMHKFNEFKKKQNIIVDNVTKEKLKNFYIVIDEINRGNISKIFGELITLIEEDKRDTYEVTLPYSKEKFKIPSNLYIIATMNSTDKSIATIDIALRRRFTFLKMEPNLDLVENEKANQLMKDLNVFIETTLNKDYMIGHAYFMSELDLEFIKEYKIKPLLEEYFYGDKENYDKALDILEERS